MEHGRTKKNVTIITEGSFDASVLNKLLKDRKYNVGFNVLPASGYSSALSKVRTILSQNGDRKIILLLDADTTDPLKIAEKKDFVNSYIDAKANNENIKTVWAIPEFEIIFLTNEKFMKELTHAHIDKSLVEIGKNAPKKMLESISDLSKNDYMSILNDKEIADDFFHAGLIKEIDDLIEA